MSADAPPAELSRLLPKQIGDFHQLQPISPPTLLVRDGALNPSLNGYFISGEAIGGEAEYLSPGGDKVRLELVQFRQDEDAYSLLTIIGRTYRDKSLLETMKPGRDVGTASFVSAEQLAFFKGATFVRISGLNRKHPEIIRQFAQALSERLHKGEGDVPALVKHLPDQNDAQQNATFLPRFTAIKTLFPNQPVLDAIDSGGDADAVAANYSEAQLLIIEFHTPQRAGDNDRRIIGKIHELWQQGNPAPTAYRRVGNYSVFVFNAPNEQTANQLIDQVHYEQVVQWLGDNPNWLKEAQRRYTETMLGTFVSVIKASGLAAVLCFGVGGLFGALLFTRRRAQQAAQRAYSDAGGMMRLNLDELTAEQDASRLIGPGISDQP